MFRFIRSIFAWRTVFRAGRYDYQENAVTRARRAISWCGGHSPADLDWLDATRRSNPWHHPTIDGIPAWRTAQGQADGRWCY